MTRTTPRTLAERDKAAQALALRKTGATYEQIAAHLGYSNRQSANRAVLRLLAAHEAENVADLRTLENMRLDDLLFAVYKAAKSGDLGAIDRALRIMERRAKLLGLDAPTQVQNTNIDEVHVVFADADPAQADAVTGEDTQQPG